MRRMICDQLTKCMEMHNKNVFTRSVDMKNERAMRTCVDILLKSGKIPIVTVQNMGTMREYQYIVNKSDLLTANWTAMPYTKLSIAMGNSGRVQEYSTINIPESTMGYCVC